MKRQLKELSLPCQSSNLPLANLLVLSSVFVDHFDKKKKAWPLGSDLFH